LAVRARHKKRNRPNDDLKTIGSVWPEGGIDILSVIGNFPPVSQTTLPQTLLQIAEALSALPLAVALTSLRQ
jgi:hypothetical protein